MQGGARVLELSAIGQHDSQVLQRGGQFRRRTDRPVVRHRLREPAGVSLKQSVAPQAGRGRPGWPGLRRGFLPARIRRGPRRLSVPGGER